MFDLDDPPEAGFESARQANGRRGIAGGTVVRLYFSGYDKDVNPQHVFSHDEAAAESSTLAVHDHRDNLHGGFAFSAYHLVPFPVQEFRGPNGRN